jgi:hypothetical protein
MDSNLRFFSQVGQDAVVTTILQQKTNGYFLDIGCGYPSDINNTYTLEKYFNWNGISIDLTDQPNAGYNPEFKGKTWLEMRKTKRILGDALNIDYKKILEENNAPKEIDYLSMDLEPPDLTLECLYKIPFNTYKFNFISFETDEYKTTHSGIGGPERAKKSREYLTKLGYTLIGTIFNQDDYYLRNDLLYLNKNISSIPFQVSELKI